MLREGVEIAEKCGAWALVARARNGYAAAGGKVRPPCPCPSSAAETGLQRVSGSAARLCSPNAR